jgi:two-component system sensor histidine kinase QseC
MESLEQDLSLRFERVRLASVFQQVTAELDRKIAEKKIVIATQFIEEDVQGLGFAIYLLLRNLLSNAVLYNPAGGRIEISTHKNVKGLVLCVDDSGPGIPAHARTAAFERFNRLNQHGPDGVGLGLSIVNHIIKIHGALIELQDSPLGGLRVRIIFPTQGSTAPA